MGKGRGAFFQILYGIGLLDTLKKNNQNHFRVPVLTFHRVSPESSQLWPPLKPDEFESILEFLGDHYTFSSVRNLFSEDKEALKKACFVTFDDAFSDFKEYALPVLEKFEIPATLFVPTSCVATGEVIWPIRLVDILDKATNPSLSLEGKVYDLSAPGSLFKSWQLMEEVLKGKPPKEQDRLLKELEEECEIEDKLTILNWEEINSLPDLIEVYPHSRTHPFFPYLKDQTTLQQEVCTSRNDMEEKLGGSRPFFAYPFGGYDDASVEVVSSCYEGAFSMDERLVHLSSDRSGKGRYVLPRFNIHNSDPKEVLARINGFHRRLKKLTNFGNI